MTIFSTEDINNSYITVTNSLSGTATTELARELLSRCAGLDKDDPQATRTPERFVKALESLTTPEEYNFTTFPTTYDEMIIVRNIPFNSLCKHHILPFIGVAHVGYVPDRVMAGLSKIARCVKYHSARLQVQEELTSTIAIDLKKRLRPRGVAVVLEAEHACMTIRGIQVPGTLTYTAAMKGVFSDHSKTAKSEFLSRIGR